MYDLEAVKAEYPTVDWTAEIIKPGDKETVEIVAQGNGGGHVVWMPKALADEQGLLPAAHAIVGALRHKGFYPPHETDVLLDGKKPGEV